MPHDGHDPQLHKTGHSNRELARLTGVHRETVGKYVAARGGENRPEPHTGVAASSPGPRSACRDHQDVILAKLEAGLSCQRIYQDLISEAGFTASYWSVRRYVARLTCRTPLPFCRIETPPDEEAQIDFGAGAPVVDSAGKRRRP